MKKLLILIFTLILAPWIAYAGLLTGGGCIKDCTQTGTSTVEDLVVEGDAGIDGDLTVVKAITIPASSVKFTLVSSTDIGDTSSGFHSIQVSDGKVYVGHKNEGGNAGLSVYNITEPTAPLLISNIAGATDGLIEFEIVGNYLYAVEGQDALKIMKLVNGEDPVEVSIITATAGTSYHEIAVSNGVAWICSYGDSDQYLVAYDVRNPLLPVEILAPSTLAAYAGCHALEIHGDRLYMARWWDEDNSGVSEKGGISVFDISEVIDGDGTFTAPTLTASIDQADNAILAGTDGIAVRDNVIITNVHNYEDDPTKGCLVTIRQDTTANLSLADSLCSTDYLNMEDIRVVGNLVLGITENATTNIGFIAFDITDIDNIVEITVVSDALGNRTAALDVYGDLIVFVGTETTASAVNANLQIYRISGITTPSIVTGSIKTDMLDVMGEADFAHNVNFRDAIYVGDGGMYSSGGVGGSFFQGYSNQSHQLKVWGWDDITGAHPDNGSIRLGANDGWYGSIHYDGEVNANLYIDNNFSGLIIFRTKEGTMGDRLKVANYGHLTAVRTTEVIGSGGTIATDQCSGLKMISSAAAVTTDTTDTFTLCSALQVGCIMDVYNVNASDSITLDENTRFDTVGGNVALTANSVVRVGCTELGKWKQLSPVHAN